MRVSFPPILAVGLRPIADIHNRVAICQYEDVMVPVAFRTCWLLLALPLVGCGGPYDQSTDAKRPYSVLQSEEFKLRQSSERYRYVFRRRALGTEFDTLALPSRSHRGHYVVMIANAAGPDRVLTVPSYDVDPPVITSATLDELVSRGLLSNASKAYLAARTTGR